MTTRVQRNILRGLCIGGLLFVSSSFLLSYMSQSARGIPAQRSDFITENSTNSINKKEYKQYSLCLRVESDSVVSPLARESLLSFPFAKNDAYMWVLWLAEPSAAGVYRIHNYHMKETIPPGDDVLVSTKGYEVLFRQDLEYFGDIGSFALLRDELTDVYADFFMARVYEGHEDRYARYASADLVEQNTCIAKCIAEDVVDPTTDEHYFQLLRHCKGPEVNEFGDFVQDGETRKENYEALLLRMGTLANAPGDFSRAAIVRLKKDILLFCYPTILRSNHLLLPDTVIRLEADLTQGYINIFIDNTLFETVDIGVTDSVGYFNFLGGVFSRADIAAVGRKVELFDADNQSILQIPDTDDGEKESRVPLLFFCVGFVFLCISFMYCKGTKKYAYIIGALILCELFLRYTQGDNFYLNINVRMEGFREWYVEKVTNIFGTYDDRETINLNETMYSVTKTDKKSVRIVSMGSSPLLSNDDEGIGVYSSELEQLINDYTETTCEVINAGVSGDMYVHALYFSEVLYRFDPDIVLLYMDCYNDNVEPFHPQYREFEKIKAIMHGNEWWIKDYRMLSMAMKFKSPHFLPVYVYNILCDSYVFMLFEMIRNWITIPRIDPDVEEGNMPEGGISSLLRLCREKGITVVLVPLENSIIRFPTRDRNVFFDMVNEDAGVYVFDVSADIRSRKHIFIDESHFTGYGHWVMSRAIFKKLRAKGLIT